MTREEIDCRIVAIMIEDGPDGHCDGHEVITDFVMSLVDPLVALLREARKKHTSGCAYLVYAKLLCGARVTGEPCTCGADAFNASIDEVLR
jgi:hypothetical protein